MFKRLVAEHFPDLSAHMEGLGADVSCVFVTWFLCVFVNFLPIEACLRVWDVLFYYRSPTVLFKWVRGRRAWLPDWGGVCAGGCRRREGGKAG